MKIHCLCLVRNEVDVIEPCLEEASRWADRIYVYDGASTDGTWEKVQAMASPCIVPWRSDAATFREGLRAQIFEAFRAEATPGDWWCQLNGDEFYAEDPRAFLASVPRHEHVVWGVNVQYYLTNEAAAGEPFTGDFRRDRERLRSYRAACAEPRFFRHRTRLVLARHGCLAAAPGRHLSAHAPFPPLSIPQSAANPGAARRSARRPRTRLRGMGSCKGKLLARKARPGRIAPSRPGRRRFHHRAGSRAPASGNPHSPRREAPDAWERALALRRLAYVWHRWFP